MSLAPIVLFVYNRPFHTLKTLNSLKENKLAIESELFIFCDGPKPNASKFDLKLIAEVEEIINKISGFKNTTINKSSTNNGLSNSIIHGVTKIIEIYGKVIVLEDDMETAHNFLDFMNKSLNLYENDENIACVSGYIYPLNKKPKTAFFIKGADCWGWATWANKWKLLNKNAAELKEKIITLDLEKTFTFNNSYPYMQMLEDKALGKNQSWAILWYASALVENKLCLYPPHSLINNIGNDGSGTHSKKSQKKYDVLLNNNNNITIDFPNEVKESENDRKKIITFFNSLKTPIQKKIIHKLKSIYYRVITPANKYGWFGNYKNWELAQSKCTGYDSKIIIEKVKTATLKVKNGDAAYERDSVIFYEPYYYEPLLNAIKQTANNTELNIIDFGGSLGSTYFQYKKELVDFKINWSIVEQKQFVEIGKNEISDKHLKFCNTIEESLNENPSNTLLLSSVLQYFSEPHKLVTQILSYNFEFIIIDRTAFIESKKDRLTIQKVPPEIYDASYPSWFFSEIELLKPILKKYDVLNEFTNDIPPPVKLKNKNVYWKGFIFKRKND